MEHKLTPKEYVNETRAEEIFAKLSNEYITAEGMKLAWNAAYVETPALSDFPRVAVFAAFCKSFECGLLPDTVHKHAHVVIYRGKDPRVDFQIGYRGLIELCRRNNMTIRSGVIYAKDTLTYEDGLEVVFRIIKCTDLERGEITHFWASTVENGTPIVEVMTKNEVDDVKDSAKTDYIWGNPKLYPEMGRKTVIKRLCKRLPLSSTVMRAIDNDNEGGFVENVPKHEIIISVDTLAKLQAHIDNGDIVFGKDVVDAMRICEQFKVKSLAELTETQAKNILANFVVINSESEETNSESEENKNA